MDLPSVGMREDSSWKRCSRYLDALALCTTDSTGFQLKETKTAKGGTDCPTLLHYLARVLLRTDPGLVNFIDEMRSVEAAARSAHLPTSSSMHH